MSYIGAQPTNVAFVTDSFSGNGSTTAFTMSVAPATTSSVLVAITGVLQDPSTYSVSGTTLTFSAAPPSGTGNISVRYLGIPASGVTTTAYRTVTEFTATAGQTTFSVPSYTAGYIDVYRNGARLGAADFTATNGTTVVLAAACNAGDLVQTVSFYVSSVLNAIPAVAGAVNSTYIANGAVGSTQIASGGVAQSNLAAGVAGNGPAFKAIQSVSQTVSNSTWTKIQYQTKSFDTANCFDNTTNYRFTPNVAGYYYVTAVISFGSMTGGGGWGVMVLRVNGSDSSYSPNYPATANGARFEHSGLVYLNGTTDYVEMAIYQYSGGGSQASNADGASTNFQAFLARSA